MQPNKLLPIIEIISSEKLNDKQKEKIKNAALRLFSLKDADYIFSEDNSIIGGFMIRYGSRICDMSIKGRVDNL